MNRIYKFIAFLLLTTFPVIGQQKITVDEIFTGAYRTKGMDELQSMKNTNQYTVLNFDRVTRNIQINLFDFATLKKVATLIDSRYYKELDGIDSYAFNASEKVILIGNNSQQIYRHSFLADYFLYDLGY